jgi:hypothetical protein
MSTSQNGWPALPRDDHRLHRWKIPARNGVFYLTLRNGSAGFLLALFALWFSEVIQKVAGDRLDDWGYAFRLIRGDEINLSNHASGTAEDLNSLQHPLGRVGTFRRKKVDAIHAKLVNLKGCIRWGGDYHTRKDEMHFEIVQNITYCEKVARRLMRFTVRGRRLIRANPTQKKVIMS